MSEQFVDESEKMIPPQSTWGELTPSQLLDVKNQLHDKAWYFKNQPQILKVLNDSIIKIDKIIAERYSS